MVRGMVSLPSGTGKDVKVAVFARGDKAEEAKKAGADKVGAEDLMEDMQAGNLDYGRVIATPDMMGVVGRLGKVLGPKGLMPNPKLGTVTPNVTEAVKAAKGGQIESASKKPGHPAGIGKMSSPTRRSRQLRRVRRCDRQGQARRRQGQVRQKVALSSSMGPGLRSTPRSSTRADAPRQTHA